MKGLNRAEAPQTPSSIRKALPGPYRRRVHRISEILEELVAEGRVYRFAPYRGKAHRYWTYDLETYASTVIERALTTPRTFKELDSLVEKPLADCSQKRRRQILDGLVRNGRVWALPKIPRSRTERYATEPPDPRDYLRASVNHLRRQIDQTAERLRHFGVPEDRTRAAALELLGVEGKSSFSEEPEDSAVIVQELARLQAHERGGLVPVSKLRDNLRDRLPDKDGFDRAVLELARAKRVALHPHDYPAGVSEAERAEMVTDGQGNYYVGATIWE